MKLFRLCVPVRGIFSEIKKNLKRVPKEADLVEIWLDQVWKELAKRPEGLQEALKELILAAKRPVIVVCKRPSEKGRFTGTEQVRIDILKNVLQMGASYVDIDIKTPPNLIKQLKYTAKKHKRKGIIVSFHDFKGTPSFHILQNKVKKAFSLGADIVKIATTVKKWSDNVVLFELTREVKIEGKKIICLGMGEKGRVSRLACPLLGGVLTFASLDSKNKTASGQMDVACILTLLCK